MASGFQSFTQGRKALDAVRKAINGKSVVDRKAVEKVWKQMSAVIKLCANPRLNITNSPPCILDILPDTYAHLQLVLDKCNENFDGLNECPYFRVLLDNLAEKSRQVLQLFKVSKDTIFDEQSIERRSLTKFALIFSHMFSEMRALYPNGVCIGKSFPITKSAAAQFWHQHFGDRYCVAWRDFVCQFETEHTIRSNMEVIALKSTIDLTCNDHVSVFEFDVFTLLFQPWATIVRNWNVLAVTHPGYQAFLTYDEVKDKLVKIKTNRVGSYLYRLSCTRLGQWAIGHITSEGNIVQTIPQNKSLIQALVDGEKEGFYLHPMGQEHNPDISGALAEVPSVTIQVTQEQYELYMEIDSSFELCKICTVKAKDVRIEPCRHLVCGDCLEQWLESNGNGCPFCRMEIKSTETVVIQPYQKESLCNTVEALAPDLPADFRSHCGSIGEASSERLAARSFSSGQNTRSSSPTPAPPIPCRRTPSTRRAEAAAAAPPPPPAAAAAPVTKIDRPPLPALPKATDNFSIPPIDYESSQACLVGASSVPTGIMPEYSTPNRRPSNAHGRFASDASAASAGAGPLPPPVAHRIGGPDAPISRSVSPPPSRHGTTSGSAAAATAAAALAAVGAARAAPPVDVQLAGMGYSPADIQKAVLIAGDDVELAKRILANFKTQEKKTLEEQLMEMGYVEEDVKKAIAVAGDNRDLAVMILQQFSNK